jgi:hypothetical protein
MGAETRIEDVDEKARLHGKMLQSPVRDTVGTQSLELTFFFQVIEIWPSPSEVRANR